MDPSYHGRTPRAPHRLPTRRLQTTRRAMLFIGGLIGLVIIGIVLLSLGGDKSVALQQRLVVRLTTLNKMVAEGEENIKNSELRELNGRLRIQLTSDQKSITDTLNSKNISKIPKDVTSNEADTASFTALEDARLNSRFDDAYRKLISQKISSTTLLMRELHDSSRSTTLKSALSSAYHSLTELNNQLTPATATTAPQ